MQRKKKSKSKAKSPRIRLVGLEAVVAATGLAGSIGAVAAPGDLDPSFGDLGRQAGIPTSYYSGLWSIDLRPDESVLFGGGGEFEYYGTYVDEFIGGLLPDGGFDTGFVAAALPSTVVYDTTLQSDGKLIGVGMVLQADGKKKMVVFRLRPDGSLDADFGLGGQVFISDGTTSREAGYSVLVDLDDHIVVAGQRGDSLLVVRLLANGALDAGFGTAGVYAGPQVAIPVRVASAPAGGYRVAAQFNNGVAGYTCGVTALTAAGALDAAFGGDGSATPQSANARLSCTSLAVQPDGRVVLGGHDDQSNGYVGRLSANGTTDPGFNAGTVPGRFTSVSALALGTTGSIFVTGRDRTDFSSALIARLSSDGTLDTTFGRAGATTVDLKSRSFSFAVINDLKVTAGGGLLVGGNFNSYYDSGAFVARLLGDAQGGGPGVLGLKQSPMRLRTLGTEQTGQVMLSVQRTGGSVGPVAVTYSTRDFAGATGVAHASPGADYTSTTGRLTWADGDVGDREIVVPIANDTNAEPPEFFEVVLESPEGGAGLATFVAEVEIAGASYPFGDFRIAAPSETVTESGQADFFVERMNYFQGAVSVTVRVATSVAKPGKDFRSPGSNTWQDVVLRWGDGEGGSRNVPVSIVKDGTAEGAEAFTLELVSPTGGAMLGDATRATVQITDLPRSNKANSGGGSFGWLGAFLLGLWGALRRR